MLPDLLERFDMKWSWPNQALGAEQHTHSIATAEFDSLTKQHIRRPIMAILVEPLFDLFLSLVFFSRVCVKKSNPVHFSAV
jgi:hypothetical protein